MQDRPIENLIKKEQKRQSETLNLIASENYVSKDTLGALGSVLTNKYAEGYPKARYYGGNKFIDAIEDLAKTRALKLFKLSPQKWSVNVQSYSGSPANLAIYLALVPLGEKIMGMRLDMGGHLTHGHKASATGKLWTRVAYGVDKKTKKLNYNVLMKIAKKEKPKLIVAGYTAYSRVIDFKTFREIADAVGAILMVDMAHFAGLVAAEIYPSPFVYADVVMTTMHKTLRGPRAAIIFSRKSPPQRGEARPDYGRGGKFQINSKLQALSSKLTIAEQIDKMVFPGIQGGPHANQIAATAVALYEASRPNFKKYAKQIVKNAKALASALQKKGWRIISGGTDTHLFLMDTMAKGISGKTASDLLEKAGIIVNKNTIPFDSRSPVDPSGIRIGTPALTTRGMKEKEIIKIAEWIDGILGEKMRPDLIRKEVVKLCRKFPTG